MNLENFQYSSETRLTNKIQKIDKHSINNSYRVNQFVDDITNVKHLNENKKIQTMSHNLAKANTSPEKSSLDSSSSLALSASASVSSASVSVSTLDSLKYVHNRMVHIDNVDSSGGGDNIEYCWKHHYHCDDSLLSQLSNRIQTKSLSIANNNSINPIKMETIENQKNPIQEQCHHAQQTNHSTTATTTTITTIINSRWRQTAQSTQQIPLVQSKPRLFWPLMGYGIYLDQIVSNYRQTYQHQKSKTMSGNSRPNCSIRNVNHSKSQHYHNNNNNSESVISSSMSSSSSSARNISVGVPRSIPTSIIISFVILVISMLGPAAQANKVTEQGDILLGGLFPIHQKGLNSTHCGAINKDRGIQRLEAMLFAIDKINRDPNLLGNIKLGTIILDTCSSDTYALNQSLEFIRASINTVEASAFECIDGSTPRPKYGWKHITGVVGGSYSEVSLQVANLLRLFKIPQVSYASTGTSLSDKTRYDFFARTVPPDTYQALALVDLVQKFNWSYVSLVTSEGQYGDSGMNAFVREAKKRSICIAINEKVPQNADANYFKSIMHNLRTKPNARGVVLFLRAEDNRGLLEAAKSLNLSRHFSFIASDGWGKQDKLVMGVEEIAEGAITVELATNEIVEFDYYIQNLTDEHNRRNPWFKEYWRDTFGCKFRDDPMELFPTRSVPYCTSDLRIGPEIGYIQESKVQFVIDAVYSFAYALHNAWLDLCEPDEGYCPRLKELDGETFYKLYLLNVSFNDLTGSEMKFDKNGDGLGRYNIYNFQRLSPHKSIYHYKRVGEWSDSDLKLHLREMVFSVPLDEEDSSELQVEEEEAEDGTELVSTSIRVPNSICSKPCKVGQIKIVQQGDKCCWICAACRPYEYVFNESVCEDCGEGRWPYPDKQSCYDLELRYLKWGSMFAIVPIIIAVIGLIFSFYVILIFLRHSDTPIVKASGRELSFILLGGIMFCYVNTFFLIAKPTLIICALQRFGVGFGFAIIYAALLTKTNRISRIFDSARKTTRRPSFISPKSQVIITMFLVSIQVIGTGVWFLLEPPGVRKYFPDGKRSEVILKCRVRDSSFLLSLLYNMFLITTCTLYAVKTRKIPENFNESKFIGFTMYTTCIIWLAFVPIYFGTGNNFEIQATTLCVSISLSAYVALFCLYSPKLYIIIFHPEKNVRKLTMNSATYKKAASSSVPTTSSNHEHVKLTVSEDNKVYAATNTGTCTVTALTAAVVSVSTADGTGNESTNGSNKISSTIITAAASENSRPQQLKHQIIQHHHQPHPNNQTSGSGGAVGCTGGGVSAHTHHHHHQQSICYNQSALDGNGGVGVGIGPGGIGSVGAAAIISVVGSAGIGLDGVGGGQTSDGQSENNSLNSSNSSSSNCSNKSNNNNNSSTQLASL